MSAHRGAGEGIILGAMAEGQSETIGLRRDRATEVLDRLTKLK